MQKNIKKLSTLNNLGLSQIFLSPFSMPKTDYWCADYNNTKVTILCLRLTTGVLMIIIQR